VKTRTLVLGVAGAVLMATGGVVGGLMGGEEAKKEEPGPDWGLFDQGDLTSLGGVLLGANVDTLRWALFNRVCPTNPRDVIRENCFQLKSISCGGQNGCACLTDRVQAFPGEINPAALPDCAYRRVGVCRWNDNQARQQTQLLVRPVGWTPPSGTTCSVIANRVLIWDSRANKKDALETAMESRCGFPISGDEWYCCPQCLLWANLCPPCSAICKYGNAWKGHEAECVAGAT